MANKGGRQPGTPKTGGRQKGSANKKTQELSELIEAACPGFNPVVGMAKIAHLGIIETWNPQTKRFESRPIADEHRVKCISEVSQYLFPKRKAVEHSGQIETTGGVLLVERVADPEEWIAGRKKD